MLDTMYLRTINCLQNTLIYINIFCKQTSAYLMEYSNNIQYTIQQTESIKTPVQEKLEDAKRVITQGPDEL
jgi:hypothetical protein